MPVCSSVSVSPSMTVSHRCSGRCLPRCRCPAGVGAGVPRDGGVPPVPVSPFPSPVLVSHCAFPSPSPAASSVTSLCLQGHSSPVTCLDFSSNGRYLASCSEDRTVRLWSTRDLAGREHRCLRANVGLDHAELVRLSPDSRYGRTLYWHPDVLQSRQSHGQAVLGSVVLLWEEWRQHLSPGHHSITNL